MSDKRILEDTFLILGTVHPQIGEPCHEIVALTKNEAMMPDCYSYLHPDWAIVIDGYMPGKEQGKWIDSVLRPFMFGCVKKGNKPVIWLMPRPMEITDYSI